jgi:ribonuclease P protein component
VAQEAESEAHVPAQQPETSQAARLPDPDAHPSRPRHPAHPAPEGSHPAVGLIRRFGDRATFDALRRDGRRARRGPMTVTYLAGGDGVRVAYAIGRAVGPAVARNRLRRRLRAAAREIDSAGPGLPAGAYLVALRPEATGRSYAELRNDLATACAAASAGSRT